VAGRDVVLDVAREHGDALPEGVLLDDLLSQEVRAGIDREALANLAAWRRRRDNELTVDGICIPQIWEAELLGEVFVPEMRIVSGLRAAFSEAAPRRLHCRGVDAQRIACLKATLAEFGVEVDVSGPVAPAPRYPGVLAAPTRTPTPIRTVKTLLSTFGLPSRVRGSVYFFPYWHLRSVFERLSKTDEFRLVISPERPFRTDPQALIRAVARGGWVGAAGILSRRRSRERLANALASIHPHWDESDALGRLLDERALTMLRQRGGETVAVVSRLRRAFGRGTVKLAVLPFDAPADAREIIHAARDSGVPTLVVQHGLPNDPNAKDMTLADAVAVWSPQDAAWLRAETQAIIEVTGNPGIASADDLLRKSFQPRASPRTIVLVEYSSRVSTLIDDRVSLRHVSTALDALARTRPGTPVTIRPHPAEHQAEIFVPVGSHSTDLEVTVDTSSAMDELIGGADLFIGAVSTATLQAGAAGVPVIFLNVTGRPAPWPFDGTTDVPLASNIDELIELIAEAVGSGEVRGRSELLRALGVERDAVDRVVALIRALVEERVRP
jgi:hypothetical protein